MDFDKAKENFKLALNAIDNKNYDLAKEKFKEIGKLESHLESRLLYAMAQLYLGTLLWELKEFEDAEEAFKKVKREDSSEHYARAILNLGCLLEKQMRYEEATVVLQKICVKDDIESYSKAQCLLGDIFLNINYVKSIEAYMEVREEFPNNYAYAQWKLFLLTHNNEYLLNIRAEHDLEIFAEAQFFLGVFQGKVELMYNYWKNIPKQTKLYKEEQYKIDSVQRIAQMEDSISKDIFYKIFEITHGLLIFLFIDNKNENFIAHYTNLNVAKLLLSNKSKELEFEYKSKLRLNTINLMNDPEEGLLLNKLLDLQSEIRIHDSAFIACFTLHHDSLNQFRLYGKKDKEEASGLSLVLGKKFFAEEHNATRIYQKEISFNKNLENEIKEKNSLATMPLYRCIYLDPTSGLIKVAQREEWSFHREYKAENKQHMLDENLEAEQNWKEYQAEILQIESEVKTHLKELAEQVKRLNPENLNDEEKELLAEILLPLRYLIKHMAFKEEQECRMIYVTQMDNPLIKYDEKINRIYIDYEASVMEHLEKIYLAPKAKDEQMVFEHLCIKGREVRKGKPDVNVKISKNPFR